MLPYATHLVSANPRWIQINFLYSICSLVMNATVMNAIVLTRIIPEFCLWSTTYEPLKTPSAAQRNRSIERVSAMRRQTRLTRLSASRACSWTQFCVGKALLLLVSLLLLDLLPFTLVLGTLHFWILLSLIVLTVRNSDTLCEHFNQF